MVCYAIWTEYWNADILEHCRGVLQQKKKYRAHRWSSGLPKEREKYAEIKREGIGVAHDK